MATLTTYYKHDKAKVLYDVEFEALVGQRSFADTVTIAITKGAEPTIDQIKEAVLLSPIVRREGYTRPRFNPTADSVAIRDVTTVKRSALDNKLATAYEHKAVVEFED